MKKFVILLMVFVCLFNICGFSCSDDSLDQKEAENKYRTEKAQILNQSSAMTAVPAPIPQNYLDRKTVAKWIERWDKPSTACYVYLISFGKILGYYVSNGKPVSTQSYLVPEDYAEYHSSGYVVRQAPDLDGTYGTLNPGIRFFTSSGIAVEWSGDYLYSDAPLKLEVPCLGE